MLYLTEEDVRRLANPSDVIDEVERALRDYGEGTVLNVPRRRLSLSQAVLMSMEAADARDGMFGHKNYLAVPGRGVLSHFFLYNSADRELVACMQANELGRLRTAAASAVAAKFLARQDSTTHAVFGAGYQAEAQVMAMASARSIRHVRVWNRTEERARTFCTAIAARMKDVQIEPAVDDPAELAGWGDIITVATRAHQPVLAGSWLRPGVFVNAVGSNALTRSEVDVDAVINADQVVVDALDVAQLDSGDLLPAIEQGKLLWSEVKSLGMIVARILPGREDDDEIILYESQGLALEDLAIGRYLYREARAIGMGRSVDIM